MNNKISWRLYSTTVLLLFTYSAMAALPDWITNPQISDSEYYGIGEGSTIDKARDIALKNILGQINTKISASSVQRQRVQNDRFSENFEQVVNSSVEELPISGFKELKTHQQGNSTYILVSVTKAQLIKTFEIEIDENVNRSQRIIDKQNQAGSPLEWWFTYRKELFKLLLVNDRLNNILPLLNSVNDKTSLVNSMANKLTQYANDYCLFVSPYHDRAVRSALREKVIQAGFVADDKACKYQLELTETTQYRLMFGTTHTFSFYGTLALIENGNTLTSESLNEVGSSPNGEATAKKAVFYRLVQQIKNDNNQILTSLLEN